MSANSILGQITHVLYASCCVSRLAVLSRKISSMFHLDVWQHTVSVSHIAIMVALRFIVWNCLF